MQLVLTNGNHVFGSETKINLKKLVYQIVPLLPLVGAPFLAVAIKNVTRNVISYNRRTMNWPRTCTTAFLIVYFSFSSTFPISGSCINSSFLLFTQEKMVTSNRYAPPTGFQNFIHMDLWKYTMKRNPVLTSRQCKDTDNNDTGWMDEDAERSDLLRLTTSDLQRLEEMRSRYKIIPILILDSMLPRQRLEFGSDDPKFITLINHSLDKNRFNTMDEDRLIGMIGLNPTTGRPLNLGVTLTIHEDSVKREDGKVYMAVKGDRRFQVQGEPWLDDTESYYVAEIEFIEGREEKLSDADVIEATKLSNALPELVSRWLGWVIHSGKGTEAGMDLRMSDIGPMPDLIGDRAMWTAALINPLPPLGVCLEIRPAMLACKNDLDRVKLAVAAIRSSIDHLSGKRRLF